MAINDKGTSGAPLGPLESWEFTFLCTGREPGAEYAFPFGLIYETADWRLRRQGVCVRIVEKWRRMPADQRPLDWIRYLARIGYLSTETADVLGQPELPVNTHRAA